MFRSLKDILKKSPIAADRNFMMHWIFLKWKESVGPEIAKRTAPHMVSGETLFVNTINSVWASHLTALKKSLITALNETIHPFKIREIRFKVSYPLRQKEPLAEDIESPIENLDHIELTAGEQDKISRLCSELEDHELRQRLELILTKEEKLKKSKLALGWKECRLCGTLTDNSEVCPFCRISREE